MGRQEPLAALPPSAAAPHFRREHFAAAGDGDGNKLFLSCVSDEFGDCRDAWRRALTRPNVEVKIQEDFEAQGGDTLRAVRSGSSFRRRTGRLDTRD